MTDTTFVTGVTVIEAAWLNEVNNLVHTIFGNPSTAAAARASINAASTSELTTAIAAHAATTSSHGVNGDIVGTNSAQTLINKTLVVANNTVTTASSGNLVATELNAALAELDGQDTTIQTNLDNHIADAVAAHAASAISNTPAGNIAATDIQAAINELDTEKQPIDATLTALAAALSAANKIPYATATDTLGELDFKDEDDMVSDSATALPSQQSVKAYVDNSVGVSRIQPIAASVAASALTVYINPTRLTFRDTILTSGTTTDISVAAQISMTISSGSTLGTVSGNQSRLAILAINNAGTVEVAIVNTDGGTSLDETGLISTTAEGGAGGADSASVIYSTTARTNVAYRVVGYIDITEATAGTWATGPTLVQGAGGNAFTSLQNIGYQKPSEVSGSRTHGTTYYNTTGRPMFVIVRSRTTVAAALSLDVDAATISSIYQGTANTSVFVSAIIPPGSSYACSWGSGTPTLQSWNEYI